MHPRDQNPDRAWTWRRELWWKLAGLEDLIDRLALRLGDALLGERRSDKLFGPHPSAF
jgi:hypothetical protein